MDKQTEIKILEQANQRLMELLEESRIADIEREKRDKEIMKVRAVIEFIGGSDTGTIVTTVNTEKNETNTPKDNAENEVTTFVYRENETWRERIKALFKFKNVALTIGQIVEEFEKHELRMGEKKLKGIVSNMVMNMVKDKLLKVYDPGVKMRGYYYANPSWFEGEELRSEHKPDLNKKLLW